ncbi:MAG: ribonuclease HI family protein [Planctomycetota bacterium]
MTDASSPGVRLTVNFDGGSRGNPGPASVGIVVASTDDGMPLIERGFFLGETTNNVAEYQGLIRGVALAKTLNPAEVAFVSDSALVVNQVNGQWKLKTEHIRELCLEARAALATLPKWELTHVKRAHNVRADALANQAMDARADVEG